MPPRCRKPILKELQNLREWAAFLTRPQNDTIEPDFLLLSSPSVPPIPTRMVDISNETHADPDSCQPCLVRSSTGLAMGTAILSVIPILLMADPSRSPYPSSTDPSKQSIHIRSHGRTPRKILGAE
ncbi:hypothetical protein I7I51_06812 [Histoplasma capsulatum]|uniref:Uncharacterized protein n=1 Tax=Ajellomyces capsulatus TaxID=5037 RepID=A0A8A1MIR3_AJECA|nr:hypothetical protein I7I51_06812 [Histoplasma capsulatum]